MKVRSLRGRHITYTYQNNRNLDHITDRFVKNTFKALDFLYKRNALVITYNDEGVLKRINILKQLLQDSEHLIRIVYFKRNAYNHKFNTILFYDTHGATFRKNHKKSWSKRNRGFNSPVMLLAHELIHCYNELYETEDYWKRKSDKSSKGSKIDQDGRDLSFPNAEEVFVIKMTNQVAKRLNEDKRSNYGRNYYPVRDVLTTERRKSICKC